MKELLKESPVGQVIQKSTAPFREITGACTGALRSAIVFSLFVNVLQLTPPLYMMQVLDRVIGGGSYETLGWLTFIAVVALIASAWLDIIRSRILNRAASWLEDRLGVDLFPHVALALQKNTPDKASGLEDLWRLRSFIASPAIIAIFDIPWMIIYLAILFLIAVPIGFIGLFGAAILIAFAIYNEFSIRKTLSKAQTVAEDSRDVLRAAQHMADEIQAMGMMPAVRDRWIAQNSTALKEQYESSSRSAKNLSIFRLTRVILQISVLGVGTLLALDGQLSAGGIIGGSIIMARALSPAEQAISAWKQALSAFGAYQRLSTLLPDAREQDVAAPVPQGPVAIKVDQASYAFPGSDQKFLQDISLDLQPGEVLTIIGPSGSGKSTLARMMAGITEPSTGFVHLGDFEMSHYRRDEVGTFIGYQPQAANFIPGTIFENLARFTNLPFDQVVQTAKRLRTHEFIMEMPDGYDTLIGGDKGRPLSGGQLQRLALTRTLCGNPNFLIMDEPDLNLDVDGEKRLDQVIQEERKAGKAILMVTHQQRMMEISDKIGVMGAGRLLFFGPRLEVLRELQKRGEEVAKAQAELDGGQQ